MDSHQLHKPVLLSEIMDFFDKNFLEEEKLYGVDGTFGRGGHLGALMHKFPNMEALALDQDLAAVDYAHKIFSKDIQSNKLTILHSNFSESQKIKKALKEKPDFVLLDIGVSSPQLDKAERGFSFYQDGPLDMRMDQTKGLKASDILNKSDLEELRQIFLKFGEVYAPQKLLEAIDAFRSEKPFETTLEFSNLVERVLGWRKKGLHPATLYFQGLRVYLNHELESLERALSFFVSELKPGGYFLLITFHSLEDRMVKRFFKSSELGRPVNKKVIKPTEAEIRENKRARSSKLRIFKKFEEQERGCL